ncbi:unnamed protein product [Closterium sp. NIES-54]
MALSAIIASAACSTHAPGGDELYCPAARCSHGTCSHAHLSGPKPAVVAFIMADMEGILQSFTLPASLQQNGVAERRIGLVMEVARTSMIHAAAPHFLWPFAVWYAVHQLNLWPRVSLLETLPTLRWTGKVGDASVFRVWGSRTFVRNTSADTLSSRAIPCVFLGFPPDAPGWQFYHPTSRRVLPSQDVTFDESVPFYRLFPYRTAPLPPRCSSLLQVDPFPGTVPVKVVVDSGAARGAACGGATSGGAEPASAELGGAVSGGAESGGAEPGGAEPGGTEPKCAEPGGAGGSAAGGTGAGGTEATSLGGAGVTAGAGGTRGAGAAGPGGARTRGTDAGGAGAGGNGAGDSGAGDNGAGGTGAGRVRARGTRAGGAGAGDSRAGGTGVGDTGVGDTGAGGAGVGGSGAGGIGAGGSVQRRPFLILPPPSSLPPPDSVLCQQTDSLTECREPASCPALPVCTVRTGHRVPGPRPPPVPDTHIMALRPSSVPLRVPLPSPPASSRANGPDPESDLAHATSPTVPRLLATVVTDPSFESTSAFALVPELVDFGAACHLDHAASLIAMDAEMASWKSTSIYVDAVPPSGAKIVDGMWILRVKRPPGSTPVFKGSLHKEIWLRCPPGFTGSFPLGTQLSLRRPVYGLHQAPCEWLDTLRTTLAALRFAPWTADPSLFLRTDTSLPPFYVLVYVKDLVVATADTKALALVKSELQKRHICTDLGELRSYLGLQITRDRARRTITLTQSHMVH